MTVINPNEGGVSLMMAYIDNNREAVSVRALELMFDLGVDPKYVNKDKENVSVTACMRPVTLEGFKLMKERGVEVGHGGGAQCFSTYVDKSDIEDEEVLKFFIECGTTGDMVASAHIGCRGSSRKEASARRSSTPSSPSFLSTRGTSKMATRNENSR